MASSAQRSRLIRFGPFELDVVNGELHRAGVSLKIHPQPLQVLLLLVGRAGQTVTREEIQHCLWSDNTFVDFERGINFCVNQVRSTLGDDAEKPRYIETVPRRGYRFVAPVTAAIDPTMLPKPFESLAVLPLVNGTDDPENEYLSDGISESIINLLSQLPNLRVIPRTSAFRYRGREADLKAVARDLKVRTVLTGKMIQHGDRLVVQTELVDVASNAQLWGGQFNRKLEDIFEVQEELARQISDGLRLRLSPEDEKRLARRPTRNREAYQFLLKSHYYITKSTSPSLQLGLKYARQAIEADPGYAEAYTYLSSAYSGLAILGFLLPVDTFPKANAAALKAVGIDDSLAMAQGALAIVRLYYEWDWPGAEAALTRALELDPNSAWTHAHWSDWLLVMGRHEEAMAEQRLAVELDPLSAGLIFKLGMKLTYEREYDQALEQLHNALELDPDFVWVHIFLAEIFAWKARYEEGLAACEKVASLFGGSPYSRALRGLILAMAGRTDEAKTIVDELKTQPKLDPMTLISLADTYSIWREKDRAFEFLEAAYQQRVSFMVFLGLRPTLDNLRSDPRFADLLRRMGLPRVPLSKPS